MEERGNIRFRPACSQALRRRHHAQNPSRVKGNGTCCHGRSDSRVDSRLGAQRRCFSLAEGAAATAAYDYLLKSDFLKPTDRVVLFNTGAGLKYTDVIAEAMKVSRPLREQHVV